MKLSVRHSITFCSALLVLGASSLANAEPLFFDDFEDRVEDQAKIGNDWTWYDQWFEGDNCEGEATGGFGPFDDGDGSAGSVTPPRRRCSAHVSASSFSAFPESRCAFSSSWPTTRFSPIRSTAGRNDPPFTYPLAG